MQNKTDSYQRAFVMFVYSIILMEKKGFGIDDFIQVFVDIQNEQLFCDIIQRVIIPDLDRTMTLRARCMSVQALTKLITESNKMLKEPYIHQWYALLLSHHMKFWLSHTSNWHLPLFHREGTVS